MKMHFMIRGVVVAAVGLAAAVRAETPPLRWPPAPDLPKALACPDSPICVNSLGVGGLAPLVYAGSPEQGMARLRATLATFTEARIESADAGSLTAIFSTRLGFRDEVVFVLDPVQAHIHFRSRSLLGYYDFGKNRSRMQAVSERFAATPQP